MSELIHAFAKGREMDRSPVLWHPLDNGEIYHWVFPPSKARQKQILHPNGCEGQRRGQHSV